MAMNRIQFQPGLSLPAFLAQFGTDEQCGEALEAYAVRSASSVLNALARRMPSVAHRKTDGHVQDVPLDGVAIGDLVVVFSNGGFGGIHEKLLAALSK
mgnify:CR=1 FL=1